MVLAGRCSVRHCGDPSCPAPKIKTVSCLQRHLHDGIQPTHWRGTVHAHAARACRIRLALSLSLLRTPPLPLSTLVRCGVCLDAPGRPVPEVFHAGGQPFELLLQRRVEHNRRGALEGGRAEMQWAPLFAANVGTQLGVVAERHVNAALAPRRLRERLL